MINKQFPYKEVRMTKAEFRDYMFLLGYSVTYSGRERKFFIYKSHREDIEGLTKSRASTKL